MPFSTEQTHLVLYEIAMSIGGSLDLRTMLRECLSVYIKKLNCSTGGVFMLNHAGGKYRYEPVFSIPRRTQNHPVYQAVAEHLVQQADADKHAAFCAALPLSGQAAENNHYHLMELPDFGLLYLGRPETPLDEYVLKSLNSLNVKLAGAGRSCLHKDALQRSEEKYRSIFENAAVGIFQCGRDGTLIQANPAFSKLFGHWRHGERIDTLTNFARFVNSEDANALADMLATQDRICDFRAAIHTPDGLTAWILLSCRVRRDSNGTFEYHEGTIEDITEKIQNEQMRLEMEAAESANQAKGQFLANMSHELRTPMNAILGFCEVLLEDQIDAQQAELIEIIHNSAKDLLYIINGILDFSKIEAGKMDIEIVPCSLSKLLNHIAALMSPKAQEKGIAFDVIQHEPLPETILTDPLRLQQCLINLVGNAVKFTAEGFVRLVVSMETTSDCPSLRFEVIDTGIGIPDDKQTTIFDSFTQADNSMARQYGGTGLGLTITSELVKLLGGRIALTSVYGEGSTFALQLPLGIPEDVVI